MSLKKIILVTTLMLLFAAGTIWAAGDITVNIKDLQGTNIAVGSHVKGDFYCTSQPIGGGDHTWHHINKDAVDVGGVASVTWTNAEIDAEVDLANNNCWFKVTAWGGDPFASTGIFSGSGLWSTFMLYDPTVADISWDVHTQGNLPPATVTSSGIYYNMDLSNGGWQWPYASVEITYKDCAHDVQPAISADTKAYMESENYVFSFNATDGLLTITNTVTVFDQTYSGREDGAGGYIQEMENKEWADVSYDADNQRLVVGFDYVALGLNDGDTFFCNLGFYVPFDEGPPAVYESSYSTYTDVYAYAALNGYVGHTLDPLEVVAPVRNANTWIGYFTIQAAIDAATSGDVINVAAGTYSENVNINKSLTLNGANVGVNAVTGTRGAESIIDGSTTTAVGISASNVILDGFTITIATKVADDKAGGVVIANDGSGLSNVTVKNNIVKDISDTGTDTGDNCTYGILTWGTTNGPSDITIQNNVVQNVEEYGIAINDLSSNVTIDGNSVTSMVAAQRTDTGLLGVAIAIGGSDPGPTSVAVTNNTLNTGLTGNGTTTDAGVGIGMAEAPIGVTATGNDITGNSEGIAVQSTTAPTAHTNKIYGNTGYGIHNYCTVTLDATNNYWGPNGPESVVSGNVAYIPWWADEAMTIVGGQPVTNETHNTRYSTIQAAITAAVDGDVIYVAAGTYNENYSLSCALKIDKSITLIGTGLPIVDGVGTHEKVAQVTADDVTIRGMKFVNSGTGASIGVYLYGVGVGYTCENTTLESCEISNNNIGLFLAEANGATIKNNTFTDNGYRSLVIQEDSDNNIVKGNNISMTGTATEAAIVIGSNSGNNIIGVEGSGNTISMPTSTSLGGDHMPFGIYMSGIGASDNTIQYNTIDGSASMVQINDNTGTTTVQENEFGMTTAPFFRGVQLNGNGGSLILSDNYLKNTVRPVEFWGADVTVTGNTIDGTTFDFINVHTFTGTVAINYNKFINCGTHFLNNQTTTEINAEKNYWGTAIGPIGTVSNQNPIDNTTPRIAVTDHVTFMPWYATATTTPATELATLSTTSAKTDYEVFTSDELTNALAKAGDGDNIVLGSGTFTGNFVIEDDITLSAAPGAVPVIQTDNSGTALTVNSDGPGGVILEGLTFTGCSTAVTVTAANTVTISSSNFDVNTDGTTVENNSATQVSAQQNYWGTTGTVGGTGTVDVTNPIENDPVVINVTSATALIQGNEAGNYDVNVGVVASLRAFQIEIMFDKTDFNAPDIGTSPGIAQCGDFYLGSLLVDAAAIVAECYTQFFVDDLTDAGEDYYTYLVTGSIFGATSAAVATGTGQLFYIKDLTSSTGVTNLDGSIISLAFIYARDESNGTILCTGITDAIITIDSVIPVIADITDAQNGYYATAPVLSSISFSDNYNVDKIYYKYDGTGGGSWIELGASSTLETSWSTSDWILIGFGALTEASHTIYFQATDEAGNTSSNISWQFNKDTTAPVALTWKVVDNDHYPETTPNANNSIALDWDNTNSLYANIHIWRKAFDDFGTNTGYPTYTGTAPTSPTLPDPASTQTTSEGWTKVTKADITSFTNTMDTRGFYYYVLYVEGLNEVISVASVVSPALSYWLGDVNGTPDGEVKSSDIALLGGSWNLTPTGSILDVGPTTDNSRNARPVPDHAIDFEDLMIFAMNYENTDYTVYSKKQIPLPQPIFIDIVTSINGNQLIAELILDDNNGFVRGLHIPVNYGNGLVLNSVTSGDIWNSTDFFIYSNKDNCLEVDGSALGELGIVENNGTIATLTFDIVGDNMDLLPGVAIARSVDNEEIECTGFALDADDEPIPTVYNLYQNYPNPFNKSTKIMFALPQSGKVKITVYNIRGQLVDELTNEDFNAGNHVIEWNNPDLKPGMYFYRIKTDNYTKVKKCLLIR